MAKFKKVQIKPLTELAALKLQKASEKHFDASELPQEAQRKLMEKLMEIARKTDGAVVAKPVGGKQYVSALVKTTKKKGKTFSFPEPNPIHAYYKIAVSHLEAAEAAQHHFHEVDNHPEQEYEAFCNLFEEITQGIVFLLMTVEGFINQLPTEDQTYQINGEAKSKTEIEWMNFTDKLRQAIPILAGIDIYANNRPVYDRLILLNNLRNDLIHLKKLELANFTYYQLLFKRLLDFPSVDVSNAVYDFISTVKTGFFDHDENVDQPA